MSKRTITLKHPGEHRPSLEAINKETGLKLKAYPKLLEGSTVVSGVESKLIFDDGVKAQEAAAEAQQAERT